MSSSAARGQRVLDALRAAVASELDRKRRLGQYAVIWKDGRVVRLEPQDITPEMTTPPSRTDA